MNAQSNKKQSNKNHVLEERISKDPNHASNVEFVKKHADRELKTIELTQYIKLFRNRLVKAISAVNQSLLDGIDVNSVSLDQLNDIAVKNEICVKNPLKLNEIPRDEIDELKSEYGIDDDSKAIVKWKMLRKKYVKQLTDAGEKLADETLKSLRALKELASKICIDDDASKKWKIYEKDVIDGVQKFLDSKLIVIDGVPLEEGTCKVTQAGGALQSDVKVENLRNKKKFYIECKLDFETARYFKYGVKIRDGRMMYDHQRYIDAAKKNDEDVKKIDDLFMKCIDLNSFLKDVLDAPEVKTSWEQFAKNIDELCDWLKNGDEFDGTSYREWIEYAQKHMMKVYEDDDTSKNLSFKTGRYPENFKDIAKAFDKYVKYYVDGYNDLIDYMIKNMPTELSLCYKLSNKDDEFRPDDFKIPHPKMSHSKRLSSNDLFQYAARMQANAQAYNAVAKDVNNSQPMIDDGVTLDDASSIMTVAKHMQKIEAKMNALLRYLKKDENDFDALLSLKGKDKLKCFFKMFMSSVGRKANGKNVVLDPVEDELGNMVVCQPVVVENSRLAQMITDFYVKKDNCAYIQIADRTYLFDKKHDPLGIEKLPVFKDAVTSFRVALLVRDSLDGIRLSVEALKPDEHAYAGTQKLSFVPKHSDFICKALKKPVEVHVKSK